MGMASMAMAPTLQLDPVSSFCSRWGLSDQSRHFLLQLPQVGGLGEWVGFKIGEVMGITELKSWKGFLELYFEYRDV